MPYSSSPLNVPVIGYTFDMSTVPETTSLDTLLDVLRATPQGDLPSGLVNCVLREAQRLANENPKWIGVSDARALYGARTDQFIVDWIERGWLRSRTLPHGLLEVRLDEIIYRRAEIEGLMGIGGEELTPEELKSMREATPGSYPWERGESSPSA